MQYYDETWRQAQHRRALEDQQGGRKVVTSMRVVSTPTGQGVYGDVGPLRGKQACRHTLEVEYADGTAYRFRG